MLGRIAKLYYDYDLTHQQIADLLGWSRVKVTRALAEARERGIVQITVLSDEPVFLDLERQLQGQYGLHSVHIGPPAVGSSGVRPLALTGAQSLSLLIEDGMQVAVGLSETLASIAQVVVPRQLAQTTFVPLQGTNPGLVTPPTPSNLAHEFGAAYGGQVHALAAPVFASSPDSHQVLSSDTSIRHAFETALKSDLALVGVGGTAENSSILLRSFSAEDADELRAAGAVGDVNARFYDSDGVAVQTSRTALVLGPTLEEFKEIPVRVAAAAGPGKVEAVRAALTGQIVNCLITDEPTARALLAV